MGLNGLNWSCQVILVNSVIISTLPEVKWSLVCGTKYFFFLILLLVFHLSINKTNQGRGNARLFFSDAYIYVSIWKTLHVNVNSILMFTMFSRPGQSQGLLYKHRWDLLIHLVTLFLPWI